MALKCQTDFVPIISRGQSAVQARNIPCHSAKREQLEPKARFTYLEGMRSQILFFFTFGMLALFAAPVQADNFVGTFGDWHVQTYTERSGKVCLMWSQPRKSEGQYTRRGEVYAYVTQRPAKKRLNEISISIGYLFKTGSVVDIRIGKDSFSMFSDGDTAWNRKPANDTKMVQSMKAGSIMITKGVSSRGTKTKDIFSLKGFTKAYKATKRSCKI